MAQVLVLRPFSRLSSCRPLSGAFGLCDIGCDWRSSGDAAARMSQRSRTGQSSDASGTPRGEGKKQARGKTPRRDQGRRSRVSGDAAARGRPADGSAFDPWAAAASTQGASTAPPVVAGAAPPSSAAPDAVPEAELPPWFAHFRAEIRNDVLAIDGRMEQAFSRTLLAYEKEQQKRIDELEQSVATIQAAQDAATENNKKLWDQVARLDKALALAETAAVGSILRPSSTTF